jgi:hypothetical protein
MRWAVRTAILRAVADERKEIPREDLADALFAKIRMITAIRRSLLPRIADPPKIAGWRRDAMAGLDAGDFFKTDDLTMVILDHGGSSRGPRLYAAMTVQAAWFAELQDQADDLALTARTGLRLQDSARAIDRFDAGIAVLAPAEAKTRWDYEMDVATRR